MMKFFRTIRQNLIEKGKLRKYLVYAIGEILLVVIGILIALQINNWNENQKSKNIEQQYLHALQEEFRGNLKSLEEVMKINEKNLNSALELSKFTGPTLPQISDKKLAALIFDILNKEVFFKTNSGVLEEVIGSGKLVVISNTKLRTSISSWNGELAKVRKQEEELARWRFGLLDFGKVHDNVRKTYTEAKGQFFDLPNSQFETRIGEGLQFVEFENLLFYFITASAFTNKYFYTDLKIEIQEILKLINEELK